MGRTRTASTRYTTELIAQTVQFLGGQRDRDAAPFGRQGEPAVAVGADLDGDLEPDDLPF